MPRKNRTLKHQLFIDKNTCHNKRRFANERQANEVADIQELQVNVKLEVYKCDRCNGWHLTRQKDTT